MKKNTTANLIVRYINGNNHRFAFLRQEDDATAIGRVEEAIKTGMLVLELEYRMMAIPFHNIKSIEGLSKTCKVSKDSHPECPSNLLTTAISIQDFKFVNT